MDGVLRATANAETASDGKGSARQRDRQRFDRFILGQRTPRRRHEQARYYLKQEERAHIW